MKKYAEDLAKDFDFTTEQEYFDYIVESLVNGQRQQVRSLFNKMHKDSQQEFLLNFLEIGNGYHESVKNICIIELTT